MSEIILFNPYYSQQKSYFTFFKPTAPLGLMYLAAYLRKFNLASKIIELGVFNFEEAIKTRNRIRFGLSNRQILNILKEEQPKIVGITSMYSVFYRDVMDLAGTIKKYDPQCKVIIGGNHASSYYNFILKDKNIDFVVIGEGEETFLELCQIILGKKSNNLEEIEGIAYRKKRKIIRNNARSLITDLDVIPFPARDLINLEEYFIKQKDNPYLFRYPSTNIITSRGCPGGCLYCTVRAVWGRSWRARSVQNVVDEIEELVKKYGVRDLAFMDDNASVNKKRWQEICDEIIKRKIDIKWTTPNGMAHWFLDKKTLRKMKKAGCYRITFGIESGNAATRQFIGKPYSLSQAKELIEYANEIGLWTSATFILGSPYENMDSIKDSIEYAKKSGMDFASFINMMPMPTSEIYQYFKKEGLINFDRFLGIRSKIKGDEFEKINFILNETGVGTKYLTREEVREAKRRAWREFFIYRSLSYLKEPKRIINKIHSWEDFRYLLRLTQAGLSIILRTFSPLNLRTYDFLFGRGKGIAR